MLILVEGCDKTGKTTLISDLKKHFPGLTIIKNEFKPTGNNPTSIFGTIGQYLGMYQYHFQTNDNRMIALDRSHITEIVYSQLRGYNSLEYFKWYDYENQHEKDFLVIYMSAPTEVIAKRFKEENETYLSAEQINQVVQGYEQYLRDSNLPRLMLSSLDDREKNLLKAIKAIAESIK